MEYPKGLLLDEEYESQKLKPEKNNGKKKVFGAVIWTTAARFPENQTTFYIFQF